jgi:predicted metalloprotease with PDZ domain
MLSREEVEKIAEVLDGMPVWGCIPGSPAQKAGIQYGDVLLRVNGCRVKCFKEYAAAQKLDSRKMTAQVAREDEIFEVEINLKDPEWRPEPEETFKEIADKGYMARLLGDDSGSDDKRIT